MSKTVLVFGATGKTGIQLCEALQEKGITHAAFVREGSQGKLTTESTLRLFGDVLNAEQVGHAIGSQPFTDIIVSLGSRELKNNPVRSEGTRNIVEALKAQNLNCRLHVVSAHGVG
ncbi:MAG TPA: epimerase, partial [Cytophagales bacterium]|nr:epimerase [Cytophagales bacterium]